MQEKDKQKHDIHDYMVFCPNYIGYVVLGDDDKIHSVLLSRIVVYNLLGS